MTRTLSGAAKKAHERRVMRDAYEREMTAALANARRRDAASIDAVLLHLRRAEVLQAVIR